MQRVLIIVAHADDEVLGPGGTIAKHAGRGDLIRCLFMTSVDSQLHGNPILKRERDRATAILGISGIPSAGFTDQMLDTVPIIELSRSMEAEIISFQPTMVYTHSPDDINQDHRAVYLAALVACRPWCSSVKTIRLFEVPGNNYHKRFVSNDYENIDATLKLKLKALKAYKSELRAWPHPRSPENIKRVAHMSARYLACEYAELFYSIREGM